MFKPQVKIISAIVVLLIVFGLFFVLSNNLTFALQ